MTLKTNLDIAKKKLYPLRSSITGDGFKKRLEVIKKKFPKMKIHSIRSGKKVYDWKIPPEWNIKEAYILDKYNKKIVDIKNNFLHLVGYSIPINKYCTKKEIINHLHSLPKQGKAIPYVTSYYKKYWGFCTTHNDKLKIIKNYKSSDKFRVLIKSNLNPKGYLRYGELILKGRSKQEILISTYLCHPCLANNELSGPIVSMSLIEHFSKIQKLNKTIRFIFIAETIGAIAYINKNLSYLKKYVIGGYNLTCIGDDRTHSCMFTKNKNSLSNRALVETYKKFKIKYKRYSFLYAGSDERQFNSPGIDLPIAAIFRSMYGTYPEYHTSLDDFNVVTLKGLKGGFKVAKNAVQIINKKIIPKSKILCEPHMSKRNLYPTLSKWNQGGFKSKRDSIGQYMNFLQNVDGKNDLDEISVLINISPKLAKNIYYKLKKNNLII